MQTTTYNTIGSSDAHFMERPLFGQATIWDKVLNVCAVGVTAIFVVITVLGAVIKPETTTSTSKGINIFFSVCMIIFWLGHGLLIYWYRQGDVDPKFRLLIYSNTILILLLCICGNLYIYA